ncbi:hypothetical protein BC833DRAFT_585734 [Globomyces pollinis-pini]|nr:hypothetical protein BC833DRAFT_585734 [Globomyces pollinis-pini]
MRGLDRFLNHQKYRTLANKNMSFHDAYVKHVHQICLAYLAVDAPIKLDLDPTALQLAFRKASLSPIPLNLFDHVIDLCLESLYIQVFPAFVEAYNLIPDLGESDDDMLLEELPKSVVKLNERRYSSDSDYEFPEPDFTPAPKVTLHHQTSFILNYILVNSQSLYSEIEIPESADYDSLASDSDDESFFDEYIADEILAHYETNLKYQHEFHSQFGSERNPKFYSRNITDQVGFIPRRKDSLLAEPIIRSQLSQNRTYGRDASLSFSKPALLKPAELSIDTIKYSLSDSRLSAQSEAQTAVSDTTLVGDLEHPEDLQPPMLLSKASLENIEMKKDSKLFGKLKKYQKQEGMKNVIKKSFKSYFKFNNTPVIAQ